MKGSTATSEAGGAGPLGPHDPGRRVAREDGYQAATAAHGTGDRDNFEERTAQFGVTERS
ncbi:hypothetical protein [Streptomyces sp. NPDC058545]|uniref:hypothetical protein n=1 Tax=Streptomyces sp. NPDC058545 TaxID=3346544 RepID=UPI003649D707